MRFLIHPTLRVFLVVVCVFSQSPSVARLDLLAGSPTDSDSWRVRVIPGVDLQVPREARG